ncbi:MAG: amidohydrolase [Fimbriimonadaceae bacterium]|nr:amidohydrolase [Fimbriimonadaceae bacterium]
MRKLYTNFRWWRTGAPSYMAVADGGVEFREEGVFVGEYDGERVDLEGKFLMPSFIDCHCHILPTGQDLLKLHLGNCNSRAEILDALRDYEKGLEPGEWLLAVHYDQTKFSDGIHLTRDELDGISLGRPILLRHVSGHAGIANSAALVAAGIDESTPNPGGGSFERGRDGRMNGVLLEDANNMVSAAIPEPTQEQLVEAILAAGEKMAGLGIACASDMLTGKHDITKEIEAYRIASEQGCKIRMRLYAIWSKVFGPRGIGSERLRELNAFMNHDACRINGIKIFADGAIGAGTAAIYGKYDAAELPEHGNWSGQLIYQPDKLNEMVRIADAAGFPVSIHSIGDYSTDLVMNAYEQTPDPSVHRIEHAMLLSDAQIDRMARLGICCTMQPEFLMRFGHAYLRQLGPERASKLKRCRSLLDAEIPLAFSSDRPIVPGDPLDGIRSAVRRPKGFDLAESVSPEEAIMAYTQGSAQANDDSEAMGSLNSGQFADFQVLDGDPLEGL